MKYISALSLLLAPLLFLAPAAHATMVTADLAGTIVVTGTFSGSGPIAFTVLVRATGQDNFLGQFTCSCTVAGHSGSITIGFTATGVFGVGNPLSGQYTILSSTGGLANLHGQGPFSGTQTPTGFQGVYSGQTLFSP